MTKSNVFSWMVCFLGSIVSISYIVRINVRPRIFGMKMPLTGTETMELILCIVMIIAIIIYLILMICENRNNTNKERKDK
jgi:hypothetical protein